MHTRAQAPRTVLIGLVAASLAAAATSSPPSAAARSEPAAGAPAPPPPATSAPAPVVIARWDFNGGVLNPPATGPGTGTAAYIGGTGGGSTPFPAGSSGDTVSGGISGGGGSAANAGANATNFPAQGMAGGTAGMAFGVSTLNRTNIRVSMDLRWSNTASKYLRAQYTTDGSTFSDMPTHSIITGPGTGFFVPGLTWDLSGVNGVDDNPAFAVRIVAIFDPANNTTYVANSPGTKYTTSGTLRFDLVTISGTPIKPEVVK
ncbi:MAG: hypothetical protein ACKVS8_09310 [Phycisphaerales bacterium]